MIKVAKNLHIGKLCIFAIVKGKEIKTIEKGSFVSLTPFPKGAPFITLYFGDERRTAAYDFKGNEVYESIKMVASSKAFVITTGKETIVYGYDHDTLTLDKDQEYIQYVGAEHMLVKNKETYEIINITNGKVTHETKDGGTIQIVDYAELEIPVFKLKDTYYDFNGKELFKSK